MSLKLKPSEIFYSQDSIKSSFSNGSRLGSVLDEICEGRLKASDFPRMNVAKRNGKYVTTDNRRLWLFRQLERLGKCGEIPVVEISSIPSKKLTTKNGGFSVKVRGLPGGIWMYKPDCPFSERTPPYLCQFNDPPKYLSSTRRSSFTYFDDEFDFDGFCLNLSDDSFTYSDTDDYDDYLGF